MALLLALLLFAGDRRPPDKVDARAHAKITILRPYNASPESWDPGARPNQREIVRTDEDGSAVRLRLTEFE